MADPRTTLPPHSAPAAGGLTMGAGEWLMLLTLSLLWGGSFFFVEIAVETLPTFTIVLLRVGIAATALWIFVLATGGRIPTSGRLWAAFFAMGLLNNAIPFGLIVWGQQSIASGLASILNATTPLFGVIVAGVLLSDERFSLRKLAGVTFGVIGVAVMIGVDALSGLASDIIPQIAILGAALSYAFAGVFGRRFKRLGVAPTITAAGQVTASTLLLIPVTLVVDRPWTLASPSPKVWAAVLALAIPSTAIAYILYFRILERAGATNILLVTFLVPVSAIVLGIGFLGEALTLPQIAGMSLIAAGLAIIDGRLLRHVQRRAA